MFFRILYITTEIKSKTARLGLAMKTNKNGSNI